MFSRYTESRRNDTDNYVESQEMYVWVARLFLLYCVQVPVVEIQSEFSSIFAASFIVSSLLSRSARNKLAGCA